ncbi:hypothetical protein V3H24_04830 [Vibrio parahaemolyticus]|uniref:hypothetical protein n=1 Tax=Vibrio harveyi group TaxID=717610 RepID=UPI001CD9F8CA|nr:MULTISPECIES: hypothetical protein [Vibrio harveyi group]MCZ6391453.1 hypothetical protein [Vibrio parahaemolyticus]MDZ5118314.1 hypothetical protein [Vibrio parahaemolyticus]
MPLNLMFDGAAIFKDGSFTDLTIAQRWVMYESEQFDHPVIESYVAVVKSNNLTVDEEK